MLGSIGVSAVATAAVSVAASAAFTPTAKVNAARTTMDASPSRSRKGWSPRTCRRSIGGDPVASKPRRAQAADGHRRCEAPALGSRREGSPAARCSSCSAGADPSRAGRPRGGRRAAVSQARHRGARGSARRREDDSSQAHVRPAGSCAGELIGFAVYPARWSVGDKGNGVPRVFQSTLRSCACL